LKTYKVRFFWLPNTGGNSDNFGITQNYDYFGLGRRLVFVIWVSLANISVTMAYSKLYIACFGLNLM